jgi:putative phage-type endonuclease
VLTNEQLRLRRAGVTASDVAAILGLSPFAGPLDVYLAKTGQADERQDTEAMRWGRELEPLVLRRYASDRGVELEFPGTIHHPDHPEILGTPDAVVAGERRGVEVKTTGSRSSHLWGEPGTENVPAHYLIQCAMYMAICDADAWDLAVLIGGQDYRVYTIERDLEIEALLVDAALRFWNYHVLAEVPPTVDSSASAARYLSQLFPTSNGVMRSADSEAELWADRLREAREAVAAARALEAEAENRLKALIGDADGLRGSFFTFYWRRSKDVSDVDLREVLRDLASEEPGLAERVEELKAKHARTRPGARSFRSYFTRDE